ncbi:hypothetical protein SSP531S_39110 [Streptomyces spongiicola]|uniref:Uncharacterized protein n=1 Tax=Streptomyces spongiicola TaxID=1690221 RepID=A0A388T2Q5_9ACTN|nr:hypothetical protein SSP531S_39110 [Streptomyces spongiicola]
MIFRGAGSAMGRVAVRCGVSEVLPDRGRQGGRPVQVSMRWPVAVHRPVKSSAHRQCLGRWRVKRRAPVAIRAGMSIRWRRMVPVLALAWKAEARWPLARVRL